MTVLPDGSPAFREYANPNRLVTTQWLQEHLDAPGLVVVESDEDVLLYHTGHIPGAVKIDWHTDLNHPVMRDYIDSEAFSELMSRKGISRDSTVVIYGDKSNWWAAYALWVFTLFGHEDVRLLDGGRDAWIAENRPMTQEDPAIVLSEYPIVERVDEGIRAFQDDVFAHFGKPLIDVRFIEEYTGERTEIPGYPAESTLRGGHIPSAQSVPWGRAVGSDGRFLPKNELEAVYYGEAGLDPQDDVIVYCRIGERSSHTWFVLYHLLGHKRVKNYDGSWTEWGTSVRVPIVRGHEAGEVPAQFVR